MCIKRGLSLSLCIDNYVDDNEQSKRTVCVCVLKIKWRLRGYYYTIRTWTSLGLILIFLFSFFFCCSENVLRNREFGRVTFKTIIMIHSILWTTISIVICSFIFFVCRNIRMTACDHFRFCFLSRVFAIFLSIQLMNRYKNIDNR